MPPVPGHAQVERAAIDDRSHPRYTTQRHSHEPHPLLAEA